MFHAAPQLGKVEVLFNGQEELDEFDYGTTSDWIEVKPSVVYDIVAYGSPESGSAPLTAVVLSDEAHAGAPAATPTS